MTEFQNKLIRVADLNEATRGIINEEKAALFERFSTHMLKVNEELNLTAIRDTDGVILKHIVDSCAIVPLLPEGARIVDIGCGGGFPTFPISILRPSVQRRFTAKMQARLSVSLTRTKKLRLFIRNSSASPIPIRHTSFFTLTISQDPNTLRNNVV